MKKIIYMMLYLLVVIFPIQVFATDYYVKIGGSDIADGLSWDTAWETITKVNSISFSPGDNINFGEGTWNEQLTIPSSGTEGNLITFRGTGMDKTVIDGSDPVNGWKALGENIWLNAKANTDSVYGVMIQGVWGSRVMTQTALNADKKWRVTPDSLLVFLTAGTDTSNIRGSNRYGVYSNGKNYWMLDGFKIMTGTGTQTNWANIYLTGTNNNLVFSNLKILKSKYGIYNALITPCTVKNSIFDSLTTTGYYNDRGSVVFYNNDFIGGANGIVSASLGNILRNNIFYKQSDKFVISEIYTGSNNDYFTDSYTNKFKLGSETQILSIAIKDSIVYGGTLPNGKLYSYNINGGIEWNELAGKLGNEKDIRSIAIKDSIIYGGTAPGGKLYSYNINGGIEWNELAGKLGSEIYIYSIAIKDSIVYGGTYPNGKLYSYNINSGTGWNQLADKLGSENEIRSLAVKDSIIYGGTSPNGKLYSYNINSGTGWNQLADKLGSETHILSIAIKDSIVYGGTLPNGKLYSYNINSGTGWNQLADKLGSEMGIYSIAIKDSIVYGGTYPNGKLYSYNINSGTGWNQLADKLGSETYIYSIAIKDSIVYGGTSPNGKLYSYNINSGTGWEDKTINLYSDVSIWTSVIGSTNDLASDPLFRDSANGDYRLSANSPAIDAGVYVGLPYYGSAPDIGAFEYEQFMNYWRKWGSYRRKWGTGLKWGY